MNALYFGFIVVGAFLEQARFLPLYKLPGGNDFFLLEASLPLMIVGIFVFNLVVSGFSFTTLSGLVFFPFPVGVLVLRALLWGALLNWLPTSQLLVALPIFVIEGEGYVLAAVSGINLGLSWLRPDWAYENRGLSRLEAFKVAVKECLHLYGLVAGLLFAAAVVEAVTIVQLGS
jgi:hypothetical protein